MTARSRRRPLRVTVIFILLYHSSGLITVLEAHFSISDFFFKCLLRERAFITILLASRRARIVINDRELSHEAITMLSSSTGDGVKPIATEIYLITCRKSSVCSIGIEPIGASNLGHVLDTPT